MSCQIDYYPESPKGEELRALLLAAKAQGEENGRRAAWEKKVLDDARKKLPKNSKLRPPKPKPFVG